MLIALWAISVMFSLLFMSSGSVFLTFCPICSLVQSSAFSLCLTHNCTKLRSHAMFLANITSPSAKEIIWKINTTCICARPGVKCATRTCMQKQQNEERKKKAVTNVCWNKESSSAAAPMPSIFFQRHLHIFQTVLPATWYFFSCLFNKFVAIVVPHTNTHWLCNCLCHGNPSSKKTKSIFTNSHRLFTYTLYLSESIRISRKLIEHMMCVCY